MSVVGFDFLTQDDERLLLEKAARTRYKPGEAILEEGSKRQAIFVIRSGLVGVEVAHLGRGVAIRQLGPGAVFGEMSFLDSAAVSASVIAREDVELDVLEGADVHSLLSSVPGMASRFYQSLAVMLAQRLRENTAMLPPLLVEDVPQVKRFHGMRTGQAGTDEIPREFVEAIEDFKQEMVISDKLVKEGRTSEADIQARVSAACIRMESHLNEQVRIAPQREKGIGAYIFRETFSFFMLSRFFDRAYTKPRGYAGDFFTIEMIYNDEAAGDSRLGRFIDRWGLDSAAATAVKNRRKLLTSAIRDIATQRSGQTTLVTSLACGPAREIIDLFQGDAPDIKATCIDIDNQALSYVAGLCERHGLRDRISLAQDNVLRMCRGKGKTVLKPQHMIYTIGLIDYLQDEQVVGLLNWMHDCLEPGGTAVVGNFGKENVDKSFMDHVLEWVLLHRDETDLQALFARSRFGGSPVKVVKEPAGVNLFAFCQRLR